MNGSQFQSSAPGDAIDQIASLQRQVFVLLLVLLVVSGTLAAYLGYVDRISHKDAANIRPQVAQMMGLFNASSTGLDRQAVPTVINQLAAYGAMHPDFAQQVLKKYNIPPVANPASVRK